MKATDFNKALKRCESLSKKAALANFHLLFMKATKNAKQVEFEEVILVLESIMEALGERDRALLFQIIN